MMDQRAAKLALARQKLKTHQEKKIVSGLKDEAQEEHRVESQQVESVDYDDHGNTAPTVNIPPPVQTVKDNMQNSRENNGVNVTEILISSKRNLEVQLDELQRKLSTAENNYALALNGSNHCKQQLSALEFECKTLKDMYLKSSEELVTKERIIAELNRDKSTIYDENINLQEQLEFTKSMLTEKEYESSALGEQNKKLQNQLDALQLQLQQISSGSQDLSASHNKPVEPDQNPDILKQKIATLEQQLKGVQAEREQLNSHYQQYLGELNKQLKLTVAKNNELSIQVHNLSEREKNLVDQISEMEIQFQNMRKQQHSFETTQLTNQDIDDKNAEIDSLRQKNEAIQVQLQEISMKYEDLQRKFTESEATIQNLSKTEKCDCEHGDLSISKLTADITSDKLAAQRATEQNKKMKVDLQKLEEDFIKMSKDKLELTEKIAAEKYLNKELTIKLAESEEKVKDFIKTIKAKDDEMIRLLNSYRDIEKKIDHEHEKCDSMSHLDNNQDASDHNHEDCEHHVIETNTDLCSHHMEIKEQQQCLIEKSNDENKPIIPKEDAMVKLQDRFLKIMDEVANLSDEKHRLEHIILQLQNETDTICEYVALYQQQRSLLKKREIERSAQIKIFQTECERLKSQLEELSSIIIRLAQETDLAVYFENEPRSSDLEKIKSLLSNLKSNTLINPHKISSELKNFHPCSCCSGQLIEV